MKEYKLVESRQLNGFCVRPQYASTYCYRHREQFRAENSEFLLNGCFVGRTPHQILTEVEDFLGTSHVTVLN